MGPPNQVCENGVSVTSCTKSLRAARLYRSDEKLENDTKQEEFSEWIDDVGFPTIVGRSPHAGHPRDRDRILLMHLYLYLFSWKPLRKLHESQELKAAKYM